MDLSIKHLEKCFEMAEKMNKKWVAVAIKTKGSKGKEIIINPSVNFKAKLEYYKVAYNEDLTLKAYAGIKVVGFTYADTLEEIEDDLGGFVSED